MRAYWLRMLVAAVLAFGGGALFGTLLLFCSSEPLKAEGALLGFASATFGILASRAWDRVR